MPRYHYFDRVVDSDRTLPELRRATGKDRVQDAISLRQTRTLLAADEAISWYASPADSADSEHAGNITYGRLDQRYVMRFAELVDFAIDMQSREIRCHVAADCPATTLRHLLLDQALPRLIGQQGYIVLHASMASTERGAVGFVGRSGWGKSTLAASFAEESSAASGDDALLLGRDDCDRAWCVPAYSGARLWSDSIAAVFAENPESGEVSHYSGKQRVGILSSTREQSLRTPLRALFLLNDPHTAPSESVQVTRLQGSESLMTILKRCFLLDSHDMALSQRLWLEIGHLMRAGLPVYQLDYPREFESLPALRARILDTLSAAEAEQSLAAR